MRERKQKPSPQAKPSHYSTRQAWCLTWLPPLQSSQILHCARQWQIPLIFRAGCTISLVLLTHCTKPLRRDGSQRSRLFEMFIISLKKFLSQRSSTPHCCDHFQMENLQRNAGFDCPLQQPTHRIGQIENECHHKNCFHWAQGGKNVNLECKCLACLRIQIACQDSSNGRAVFSEP